MRTPHKLAAVLFVDIAGYTAIMADNEELALEKLAIFKAQLNKSILLNSGQIVQYFGDGALCTFESSVKAVECAVQLQTAFGKGTIVPVRIGIHTGDVVFKEGNVYGDAVNIASRIESIGQPGAVLVSGAVRGQIKSNSQLEFSSLGSFYFKNIGEPIEVYALSNEGFTIPLRSKIEGKITQDKSIRRVDQLYQYRGMVMVMVLVVLGLTYQFIGKDFVEAWNLKSTIKEIANDGLIIFDFENNTGDTTYNNLQCRIHSILSKSLIDNNIKVKNHSTLCRNSYFINVVKSQFGPGNKLAQLVGSKYALEGYLFKTEDSLGIQARIFSIADNEDLHITDPILMSYRNINDGIKKLTVEILNFWKVKDDPLFQYNLPNPGWHEVYYKAISLMENDHPEVLELIDECKKIDSNQFRPDFLAMEVYDVYNQHEKIDSIIQLLETKSEMLSESELNLLNFRKALYSFNYRSAYERYLEEYQTDPKNTFLNYSALSYAVKYVNEPQDAINIGNEIPYEYLDYSTCSYCMDRITLLARAYIDLSRYDEAIEMLNYATEREIGPKDLNNILLLIRALVRKNEENKLMNVLERTKHEKYKYEWSYKHFVYWTAREYIIINDSINAKEYINQYTRFLKDNASLPDKIRMAELLLGIDQLEKAKAILMEDSIYHELKEDDNFLTLLRHIDARLGNYIEAQRFINYLESLKTNRNRGVVAYYQSRVAAGFEETAPAIDYLTEAIINGKIFTYSQFQNDLLFKNLNQSRAFQELINNI